MTTWLRSALAVTFLAGATLPATAFAQPKAPAPKPAAPAAAPAPAPTPAPVSADALTNAVTKDTKAKPKIIDFEDETIRGTLTKPEGDFIDANRRAKQKSLIKIRRHFVPELLKSADDV